MARSRKISELEECILPTTGWVQGGYAYMRVDGRNVRVTRELMNARKGEVVRHKCDNPACINPAHLELGTPADNSRDMVERGRSAKGEKHGRTHLTQLDVEAIRDSSKTQRALAAEFHVSQRTIGNIAHRRVWNG